MTSILIIILIISQLICFYLIFILNAKISKFKDLEIRQDKLMEEMENTISVYLLEMKEENDRFIQELSKIKPPQLEHPQNVATTNIEDKYLVNTNDEQVVPMKEEQIEQIEPKIEKIPLIPKTVAKNAYIKQQVLPKSQHEEMEQPKNVHQLEKDVEQDSVEEEQNSNVSFEEKIIALHKEGKTIEEIAKITQKGKTEIELLLKFQA